MDYLSHYLKLIDRATHEKFVIDYDMEVHHIVPRCMGGGDEHTNLVLLTTEEHLVAHRLLTKIFPNNTKIQFAYYKMSMGDKLGDRYLNNKSYASFEKWIDFNVREKHPEEYCKFRQAQLAHLQQNFSRYRFRELSLIEYLNLDAEHLTRLLDQFLPELHKARKGYYKLKFRRVKIERNYIKSTNVI